MRISDWSSDVCSSDLAFQFPDGIQVLSAGALRGLKDTRVPMLLAACAYWGIGMPLGAWLGLWLGWGPRGMWIGLIAGLVVAAVLLGARFLRSSTGQRVATRSEEHTSELQSLMRNLYAV